MMAGFMLGHRIALKSALITATGFRAIAIHLTGGSTMADQNQGKDRNTGKRGDDDSGLQEELNRESEEGDDSIGDVGSNRNLSGSSTWETLPNEGTPARDQSRGDQKT
jgi:hypothetical protein